MCARPARPPFRIHQRGIHDRPRPIDPLRLSKPAPQTPHQLRPDTRPLPLIQPPPTGLAARETLDPRQRPPRDPMPQHIQNPLQTRAIVHPLAARIPKTPLHPRQQRLHLPPQPIRHPPRLRCHHNLQQSTTTADEFATATPVPAFRYRFLSPLRTSNEKQGPVLGWRTGCRQPGAKGWGRWRSRWSVISCGGSSSR